MNLTITTSTVDAAQAPDSAPVLPSGEPAGLPAQAADAVLDLADALPSVLLPGLQFGQWLDQAAAAIDVPPVAAADQADAPSEPMAGLPDQQSAEAAPAAEVALLNAMAMPLMPLAQAAQANLAAVAAALPGAPALPSTAQRETASAPTVGAATPAGTAGSALPQPAVVAVDAPVRAADAAVLPATLPATPARIDNAGQDIGGAKPQVQAAPSAAFTSLLADAPKEQPAGASVERSAVAGAPIAASVAPGAPTVDAAADTVALSGPPTAWRQNLREALGERLQLQVGRNAEQAVIRLDPPNLGQVEIAIRHSAGTLEVTISASHRDVVRQLQAVSENLRSDLAQRQFTDVAVNVAPTRASNQASPFFGGDGQGRGRQQDGQQNTAPGLALAEAHQGSGRFTLNT